MQLILDGTDNFETRYLINDYAVKNSVPWIYSAAVGSYCATMNVVPEQTACLACIFPDSPKGMVETCDTAGILNSAVNLVASLAATRGFEIPRRGNKCSIVAAHAVVIRCLEQSAWGNLGRYAAG